MMHLARLLVLLVVLDTSHSLVCMYKVERQNRAGNRQQRSRHTELKGTHDDEAKQIALEQSHNDWYIYV
jgi:hypothetical protein